MNEIIQSTSDSNRSNPAMKRQVLKQAEKKDKGFLCCPKLQPRMKPSGMKRAGSLTAWLALGHCLPADGCTESIKVRLRCLQTAQCRSSVPRCWVPCLGRNGRGPSPCLACLFSWRRQSSSDSFSLANRHWCSRSFVERKRREVHVQDVGGACVTPRGAHADARRFP